MSVPGFTAGASLHPSRNHYRTHHFPGVAHLMWLPGDLMAQVAPVSPDRWRPGTFPTRPTCNVRECIAEAMHRMQHDCEFACSGPPPSGGGTPLDPELKTVWAFFCAACIATVKWDLEHCFVNGCGIFETCCGGGRCADTSEDHDHCGDCGHACLPCQRCQDSACIDACPVNQECCDSSGCADLMSNPNHCGECGLACPPTERCCHGVSHDSHRK